MDCVSRDKVVQVLEEVKTGKHLDVPMHHLMNLLLQARKNEFK